MSERMMSAEEQTRILKGIAAKADELSKISMGDRVSPEDFEAIRKDQSVIVEKVRLKYPGLSAADIRRLLVEAIGATAQER